MNEGDHVPPTATHQSRADSVCNIFLPNLIVHSKKKKKKEIFLKTYRRLYSLRSACTSRHLWYIVLIILIHCMYASFDCSSVSCASFNFGAGLKKRQSGRPHNGSALQSRLPDEWHHQNVHSKHHRCWTRNSCCVDPCRFFFFWESEWKSQSLNKWFVPQQVSHFFLCPCSNHFTRIALAVTFSVICK